MKLTLALLLILITASSYAQQVQMTAGDRYRLENIERSIRIRQESRISQNQDEISALQAEKRAIYAKYGIDIRPRRTSDAEWEIMELERENRDLKRKARD